MHGNHQDDNYNKGSKSIAFVAIGKVSQVGADPTPPPTQIWRKSEYFCFMPRKQTSPPGVKLKVRGCCLAVRSTPPPLGGVSNSQELATWHEHAIKVEYIFIKINIRYVAPFHLYIPFKAVSIGNAKCYQIKHFQTDISTPTSSQKKTHPHTQPQSALKSMQRVMLAEINGGNGNGRKIVAPTVCAAQCALKIHLQSLHYVILSHLPGVCLLSLETNWARPEATCKNACQLGVKSSFGYGLNDTILTIISRIHERGPSRGSNICKASCIQSADRRTQLKLVNWKQSYEERLG